MFHYIQAMICTRCFFSTSSVPNLVDDNTHIPCLPIATLPISLCLRKDSASCTVCLAENSLSVLIFTVDPRTLASLLSRNIQNCLTLVFLNSSTIEVTVNCNFAPLLYKPILLYLLGTAIHLLRYPQIPSFHRLNRCQWYVERTSRCHRPCGSTPCWYILYPRLYFLGFKALLSLVSIQLSNWLLVSLTFCLSPSKSSMIFP